VIMTGRQARFVQRPLPGKLMSAQAHDPFPPTENFRWPFIRRKTGVDSSLRIESGGPLFRGFFPHAPERRAMFSEGSHLTTLSMHACRATPGWKNILLSESAAPRERDLSDYTG